MSVYIKGMEMPTKCEECEWSTTDRSGFFGCRLTGNIVIRKREKDRPDWCPLVHVPEHGRLIDADALCEGRVSNDNVVICAKAAPTIIPADPAEEGKG